MNPEDQALTQKQLIEVDLSSMAKMGSKRLIGHIFNILTDISRRLQKEGKSQGALIVLGAFAKHDYRIPGIRQIRDNPVTQLTFVTEEGGAEELEGLFGYDGAIIIDRAGQILCARAYLVVEQADIPIDEECNTRHLAAASFSRRSDVVACFTLSEETGRVRVYVEGKQEEMFDPHEKQVVKHS